MKKIILLLALYISSAAYAQTSSEHLENGKLKLEQKEEGAALKEFNKAIETDANLPEAYYYRAFISYSNKQFKEALSDLNQAIALKPKYGEALLLRGNCYIKTDQKEKACEDFIQAKQLGDLRGDQYIEEYFCEYKPKKGESMVLDFPEQENWHITYQNQSENQNIFLLGRSNETLENWTEQAGMLSIIGLKGVDLSAAMNDFYQQEKGNSPKAKLTFLEKDLNTKYPWILYAIENIYNAECKCYESKICYLIQGEQSFYSSFRSVKGKTLSKEQKERLTKFFKTCEMVYQ